MAARVTDAGVEYKVETVMDTATHVLQTQVPQLVGKVLLIGHEYFPANQEDWPTQSPTQVGWWARIDRCFQCADQHWWCVLRYLDHTERFLGDTVSFTQLLPALRAQASGPTRRVLWLTKEQLGDYRLAVGSLLPRSVQTFWEDERRHNRPIPSAVAAAMQIRDSRLRREPRRTWAQQGLPYASEDEDNESEEDSDEEPAGDGSSPPRTNITQVLQRRRSARIHESWESVEHHQRERGLELDPKTCVLHMDGQAPQHWEIPTSTQEGLPIMGDLRYTQARVTLNHGNLQVWSGERAKYVQWTQREGIAPEEGVRAATTHAEHTAEMEEQGYHTLSWQIATQIQQQLDLDCLVGPSMWEACPTFQRWIPGFDADMIPEGVCPLLHLEAVPEHLRYQAVAAVTRCERWAVVGIPELQLWQDKLVADRIFRHLDEQGRDQLILKTASRKVYSKGWSLKGDKEQHQGGRLTLWTVPGHPKPTLREGAQMPPVTPFVSREPDLQNYISHLPSGPHLANEGQHGWTDGSVRTTCKTAGAGVWFRHNPGTPTPPTLVRTIGGEPVIIRGEMGALIAALRATPHDTPITLYTDSLSSLWIVRRC